MSPDSDSAELAAAVRQNFFLHAGWLHQGIPTMSVRNHGDMVLVDSGLPSDTFNLVCCSNLTPQAAEARIRTAIEYFRNLQRPFTWWNFPGDLPENLGTLLQAAGLEPVGAEAAMTVDLTRLTLAKAVPGLAVRRVSTEKELEEFSRLLAFASTPPDLQIEEFYQRVAARLFTPDAPMNCYIGYMDNRVVGTSELTGRGGVVGLYNVATSREYRHRGIGSAMTVVPLIKARAFGAHTAVLQATEEGRSMYEGLGFQSFGTVSEYKPPLAWFRNP